MWLKASDLKDLGVTPNTIWRKTSNDKWKSREFGKGANGKPIREVLLESLPHELQLRWATMNAPAALEANGESLEADGSLTIEKLSSERRLTEALMRHKPEVRDALLAEAQRLLSIVNEYEAINPKHVKNADGKWEFAAAVLLLCRAAVCTDALVLGCEPKRKKSPSPLTLDGWARKAKTDGLLTFIRQAPTAAANDGRRAAFSALAVEWTNKSWRNYPSPRHLYKALRKKAKRENWKIPSESFFYRKYTTLPAIVHAKTFQGEKTYTSKYAPYVPRDYSDLAALQVLCGDHSVRDVTVMLPNCELTRPWLTMWQDLRTGLIWGWHLDLTPSSNTIGLAYANGVHNFGAQPYSRPEDNFFSYLQHDLGKDYLCFTAEGKTLKFGKAMRIEGGLNALCMQLKIGFLDEMGLKGMPARGRNAKEKFIERTHRDISDFEENHFASEYCGRDAKNKPDKWVSAWHRHQKLLKKFDPKKPVNREILKNESPFMMFDDYRDNLAAFINEYNHTEHKRSVLGGATIIPIDEYQRLYTTKYEITDEALALFLMRVDSRKIGKLGVQMFGGKWFQHEAMSEFKGESVEVRYSDGDYSRVWAILPNGKIVESVCINPGSIINPNKQTFETVKKMEAHERKMGKEWLFIQQSNWRGETTEDRVAQLINPEEVEEIPMKIAVNDRPTVHQFNRFSALKLANTPGKQVSTEQVEKAEVIDIFRQPERAKIKEEWED